MAKNKNRGMRFIPFTSKSSMSVSSGSSVHVPKSAAVATSSWSSASAPTADFTFHKASNNEQKRTEPVTATATSSAPPDEHVLSTLHAHLFHSFVHGVGSDVILRVRKWHRQYSLHKVILTQSSFFNTLFHGSFSEITNEVELTFDDPNITRASFEYCIAYLYGRATPLVLDDANKPTPLYPLTPSYPTFQGTKTPDKRESNEQSQPATPQMCVALVATAIYLGCPSIANRAINLILASISPLNASFFLRFALGEGLGDARCWWDGEQDAGVGLEGLGKVIDDVREDAHPLDIHTEAETSESAGASRHSVMSDHSEHTPAIPIDKFSSLDLHTSEGEEVVEDDSTPSFHYGAASDKIGEACVCWLARWALDIIEIEDVLVDDAGDITHPSGRIPFATWSIDGIPAKWIRVVLSSDSLFTPGGEWQRYKLAARIVELRRRQNKGALSYSDECEFDTMFADGIYYSHMTFEQLAIIQREVSPTTGRPYVPIRILQQALWAHSELKNIIEEASKRSEKADLGLTYSAWEIRDKLRSNEGKAWSDRRFFPVSRDSTDRLGDASSMYSTNEELNKYVAPTNTLREGLDSDEASGLAASTHDPLVGMSSTSNTSSNAHRRPHTEAQLFGLQKQHKTGAEIARSIEHEHNASASASGEPDAVSISSASPTAKRAQEDKWTLVEPLRFAVEYWIKSELEPRAKMFSHAVFYAGSYVNAYIQINEQKHKHGNQLGIYVHRQSMSEPLPYASSPPTTTTSGTSSAANLASPLVASQHYPLSPAPTMDTILRVNSTGSDDSHGSHTPPTDTAKVGPGKHSGSQNVPLAPYRDHRKSISAFFAVQCSAGNGTAFTKFSSAPDSFTTSQSWGWKSSVQRSSEYLANHNIGHDEQMGLLNSLRAVVTVGLV